MPTYVYHCDNCLKQTEIFQRFTDDPLTVCPRCNAVALRKVYQPVGIVFKGKGFYATDNRSPSGQQYSHKAEGDGGNGSKSHSESKTESPSKEPTKASTTSTAE